MGTSAEQEEYARFLEKVKRTIYVDNLSPHVTDAIMKAAFNQFGNVRSVQFIPNYFEPKHMPQAALVEMENLRQAKGVLNEMENYPFMISGMPRRVRGFAAKLEMFDERPRKPGRRIICQWVDPKEPDFAVVKKIKHVVRKHCAEASLVLEHQRKEEEKLANQQNEMLKGHYKKLELLDSVLEDGTVKRLARQYNMNVPEQ